METIKSAFVSREDVLISSFGKFCVKEKRQRRGRNPSTRKRPLPGRQEGGDVQVLAGTKVNGGR
jgi:integration host factor subunit alpha